MRKKTKWAMVYKNLRDEISQNNFEKGEKVFTVKGVSSRFCVSSITASKALSKLAEERYIKQKPGVGSIINRTDNERVVYFLVPDLGIVKDARHSNKIFFAVLSGVMKQSAREGLHCECVESDVLREIYGEILIANYINIKGNLAGISASSSIIMHAPKRIEGFHTVRHGLTDGSYLAVKHLIENGRKRVAFLSGELKHGWHIARFQGYLEALKEKDLSFDIGLLKETTGETREEDWCAFEEIISNGNLPDAVFCANDSRALNILAYCKKKKIKVPGDIAVCGFDNLPGTEKSDPALTTVDSHLHELGEEAVKIAVRMIYEQIENPIDILIKPELIVRDST